MKSTIATLKPRLQLAALPWRLVDGRVEVLMVTSRLSNHWLIPKGWPMRGAKPRPRPRRARPSRKRVSKAPYHRRQSAVTRIRKVLPDGGSVPCEVDVYALRVSKELPKWPETGERRRQWMPFEEAAALAFEPSLAALLKTLEPILLAEQTISARKRKSR